MDDAAVALACRALRSRVHPAIDHACAGFEAARADAALDACRVALAERVAAGDGAWSGSRLTGDGLPFEIAFSTGDERIRFTVEPGARTLDPEARLAAAGRAIERLGASPIPVSVMEGLQALQRGHEMGFGAWVGCRVGVHGVAAKLYAEVPANVPLREHRVELGTREVTPRIVAYLPAARTFEVYLRARGVAPGETARLLAVGGLEHHAGRMLQYIEEIHGRRLRDRLPGPVGVSYAWPTTPRVTLHFYARALWGPDAAIRREFSRAARALGWDDAAYLRATLPVAERNDWKTFHGLVGVTLDAAGAMALTIGLRPPAP